MIRFLFLLLVVVFCIINQIKCSKSIQALLPSYYDSETVQQFKEDWKKYQNAFENAIGTGLQDDFGANAVNVYVPKRQSAHWIASGFKLNDGVVDVFFNTMLLRELPHLIRPKLKIDLPSNYLKTSSRVGRMFIDTTYYVARNSSSEVYARPEDQKNLSPFSLQQVDHNGKVTIIADDCLLSGFSVVTLSGDSVNLGHTPVRVSDCKFTVEISTPNSGAPPVIAPYFPKDPKEKLEQVLSKPLREELQVKLQSALYSYVNTSVLFGPQPEFRTHQKNLLKSYGEFVKGYVSKVNQNTLKANQGPGHLPNYKVQIGSQKTRKKWFCEVTLRDMKLYGLETAFAARAGGPYTDGRSTTSAADAIVFSSMQVLGKLDHGDGKNVIQYDFTAELEDVAVDIIINIGRGKTDVVDIRMTGWRSLAFSIIPRETYFQGRIDYQTLVYGHILNELPKQVINHLTSILGGGGGNTHSDESSEKKNTNNGQISGEDEDSKKQSYERKEEESGEEESGVEGDTNNGQVPPNSEEEKTLDGKKNKEFLSDDFIEKDFFSDDNIEKDFFSDDNIEKDFFTDDNVEKDFITDDNIEKDFISKEDNTDGNNNDSVGSDDGRWIKQLDNKDANGEISNGDGAGDNNEDNVDSDQVGNDGGGSVEDGDNGDGDDVDGDDGDGDDGDGDDGDGDEGVGDDKDGDNGDDDNKDGDGDNGNGDDVDDGDGDEDDGDGDDEDGGFFSDNSKADFFSDFLDKDFFSDDDFRADNNQGELTKQDKYVGEDDGAQSDANDKDVSGDDGAQPDANDNDVSGDDGAQSDAKDNDVSGDAGAQSDANDNDVSGDDGAQLEVNDEDVSGDDGAQLEANDEDVSGDDGTQLDANNEDVSGDDMKSNDEEQLDSDNDENKPFISDDVIKMDFFSDNLFSNNKAGGKKKLKADEQFLDENFFSDNNAGGKKKLKADEQFLDDNFFSDNNAGGKKKLKADEPFLDDNFFSDNNAGGKKKLKADEPFLDDNFFSDNNAGGKKKLKADEPFLDDNFFSDNNAGGKKKLKADEPFLDDNFFSDNNAGRKKKLKADEPFLDDNFFSDNMFKSRRFVANNDTADIRNSGKDVNQNGTIDISQEKTPAVNIASNNNNKSEKLGTNKSTEDTNKKDITKMDLNETTTILPPNVHNAPRLNNLHMSENEVR